MGNVLDHTVIYPTPPQKKTEEAKAALKKLIDKHNVDVISIGNGTASKTQVQFMVRSLLRLKETPKPDDAADALAAAICHALCAQGVKRGLK